MTALLWALVALVLIPYLCRLPVISAIQQQGGYDNHHPRTQQATLTGRGARANAAHYNSFEALQLYLAALLACVASGNTDALMGQLAWGYVICRLAFVLLYLADKALARSIVWVIGIGCVLTMLSRAALSVS